MGQSVRGFYGLDGFSPISLRHSLLKVFWKGEFEGKNLFFKKGFPLLIKLEKTSIIGSQLAGDLVFSSSLRGSAKDFYHKEHKEYKEMEGGNEANVVSGITQFAEGEPNRWKYDSSLISSTIDNLKRQDSTKLRSS